MAYRYGNRPQQQLFPASIQNRVVRGPQESWVLTVCISYSLLFWFQLAKMIL